MLSATNIYDKQKKTVEFHLDNNVLPVAFFGKLDVIKERLSHLFDISMDVFDCPTGGMLDRFLCYVHYNKMYFYDLTFYGEKGDLCFAACLDIHDLTDEEVKEYYGFLK